MRVALAVERFDPRQGGLEKWTVALAEYLIGRGHGVEVLAFEAAHHGLPVRLHRLPPATGLLARARAVEQALRGLEVDVVHDAGLGWSGDVLHPQMGSRREAQARLVATHPPLGRLRAALSPVSLRWRRDAARLEARQVAAARRVVAVSRLVRAQLCRLHGLPEESVAVIPNGVDTAAFAPEALAALRAPMRARLGVPAGCMLVLASAFNLRLKGVDTALRALGRLAAEGAEVRLAVAGGLADAGWMSLVRAAGLEGRARFLGPVDDMLPLFAAADVLAHPTRWDACSLSTLEGQAAGLPVVTTAMNGAAERIAEGETGFVLASPEDVAGLARCLGRLLDPDLRRRVGEAARLAARRHDARASFAALEEVLHDAAARRRAGTRPHGAI